MCLVNAFMSHKKTEPQNSSSYHKYIMPVSCGSRISIKSPVLLVAGKVVSHCVHQLQGEEKRDIVHYYFQAWPDHGVPRYATALLGFIRKVRKSHFPSDPAPLLVHCSAGVGRTGTFIVLDIMLQVLEAQAGINVYHCILKLRRQRCSMVQTEVWKLL